MPGRDFLLFVEFFQKSRESVVRLAAIRNFLSVLPRKTCARLDKAGNAFVARTPYKFGIKLYDRATLEASISALRGSMISNAGRA